MPQDKWFAVQSRFAQCNRQILARRVSCQIFGGIPNLQQRQFQVSAPARSDQRAARIQPLQIHLCFFMVEYFHHQRGVVAGDNQILPLANQLHAPVTPNIFFDVAGHVGGQSVLRESLQASQNFRGGQARRSRVPQGKRRDAIGMNILRRFFQFGKTRQRITRLFVTLVLHFKQDAFIALHN